MKKSISKKLNQRKQRIKNRLNQANRTKHRKAAAGAGPELATTGAKYELADKTQAIVHGGIPLIVSLAQKLGLTEAIDRRLQLLKFHLPYHESDHVMNFAINSLCGGTCLQDIELRRNDENFLNALGADAIPDPTTAGDFCRRFNEDDIDNLHCAIDDARINAWQAMDDSFSKKRSSTWTELMLKPAASAKRVSTSFTKGAGVTIRC